MSTPDIEPSAAPEAGPTPMRLGALLKQAGLVTDQTIEYALKIQKATNERVGNILLKLRLVTDTEIAKVLARQAGLPYLDLEGTTPDAEALSQLPYAFAKRADILPVAVADGKLQLAVADPQNDRVLAQIGRYSSHLVALQVAPLNKLRRRVERFYHRLEHPLDAEIEKITTIAKAGRAFSSEQLVELFLDTAVDLGASDVHFNPTENVTLITYRIDGVLQPQYSLPAAMHNRLISTIKISAGMDIAEQNRPQDGRMTVKYLGEDFDLRISTVPTAYGENMVIRVLSSGVSILSLSDLGFDDDQVAITGRLGKEPHGMILATGPTGSGKSTTLYALLRSINCIDRNVMTVEDPIEFDMPMAHQVAVNEKAGITFASAIRTFFRQDPDVILVGEIRDEETATLGIRAALTGHLVLSSLHANDAAGAITRLNDLGVGFFLLSTSLSGIIAQRLVRRLCPYCKRPAATTDKERQRFKLESAQTLKAVGCAHCRGTGYLGRLAIGEVMEVDEELRELIAQGKSSIEINRAAVRKGMRTLKQSALQLVAAGATDLAEVDRVVK